MNEFVKKLKSEVDKKIQSIESSDDNILKKCMYASAILEDAFERLKEFIIKYDFKDETEEIFFFKEVKPRLFSQLIYFRKVFNIEMNCPRGSEEAQKAYYAKHQEDIQDYINKRLDFYRYFRSGFDHHDHVYFLRGSQGHEQYYDSFSFERDPHFSTICDFKVAKLLANDQLEIYLKTALENLREEGFR